MTHKSRIEKFFDFVAYWTPDYAGRFEIVLQHGERVVIQDCYLSWDQADRPDRIWINYDSTGHQQVGIDPVDVAEINDAEQQFDVLVDPPGER